MFDTTGVLEGQAGAAVPAGLPPARLADLIAATHRMESVLIARRLGAIAALLDHHGGTSPSVIGQDPDTVTGYEQTCAEVSALMNLAPAAAGRQVHYAEVLSIRFPEVGKLFAGGGLDWRTVQLIVDRTDLVMDDDLIAGLDRQFAARAANWISWSRRRVINAVDAAVLAIDPDAARRRRKEAVDNRYIWVSAEQDGMAEIRGNVAASQGAAFDRRLTQLADGVCPADPRSLDQRRVDALAALTEGVPLACGCGRPECPVSGGEMQPSGTKTRVVLNVIATADTIEGISHRPGYLEGFGVIDADQVRELAEAASQLVLDAAVDPAAARRYRPSAAVARAVRCRDLTCRFPGCSRRATICDLDHTIPFDHLDPSAGGQTVPSNLKCLCRFHHRMKTFGGWADRQLADGTVIWTSPSGATFTTKPGCLEVIPELADGLSVTEQRPLPQRCQSRARQRAAQVSRIRRDNPKRVADNYLYEARRGEIADRRWRNGMRAKLFLLKGGPSTSPYCRWINDPYEPEELPPDWQPPPLTVSELPDEPPF